MYDESWENFREECLLKTKERNDSIIKEFLKKSNYTGTVGYYFDSWNKTVHIYAKHPGILIGKGGENVRAFESSISEYFGGGWTVEFIEVRGGFVTVEDEEK